jgi:tetratricopeptide (TPR) repeat protein
MLRNRLLRQLTFGGLLFLLALGFAQYKFGDGVEYFRLTRAMADWSDEESDKLSAQLVALKPEKAEYQFLRAKVLRRIGRFSEANTALQIAEKLKWPLNDIGREKILSVAQSGGVRGVSREISLILNSNLPDAEAVEVYNAIANGHAAAYDIPEFMKCIDYWLKWQPEALRPKLLLADFLFRIGNHNGALQEYQKIVEKSEGSWDARFGLAKCQLTLNDPGNAEKNFEICYQQRPSGKTAVNLAKCYARLEKSDEALQMLKKYQDEEDRSTKAEILEELGRWHVERGLLDEARGYIDECLKVAPENFSAWHALSMIRSLQGDSDAAREALEHSQQLQKDASRLLELVSELADNPERDDFRLEAAQICFRNNRKSEALGWLNSILQRNPDHAEARETLKEYTSEKRPAP